MKIDDTEKAIVTILEAYLDGDIDCTQRDDLLTVLEMKTKAEYRKRSFKKRFKFHPSKDDPNKGTITVDGETYRVDIGNSGTVTLYRPDGESIETDRRPKALFTGGDIILDMTQLAKLKTKEADAITHHEIAHIKFQGIDIGPDWNITNKDKSLSPKAIEEIIKSILTKDGINYNQEIRNNEEFKNSVDDLRAAYVQKLKNNPNRDKVLQDLRNDAIRAYKKFEKGGHTNWKEFEADRYAANKTSERDIIQGLKRYTKNDKKKTYKQFGIDPKIESKRRLKYDKNGKPVYADEKQEIYYTLKDEINKDNSTREKVLKNPELKKYKDIYK